MPRRPIRSIWPRHKAPTASSTNLRPRAVAADHPEFQSDDLRFSRIGGGENLTADADIEATESGLRLETGTALRGLAAISGRTFVGNGMGPRGLNSRALLYNGLPGGSGNTMGGATGGIRAGPPTLPTGIGSGYQGGSPTGGINTPGGSYGMGTQSMGAGNFYGAGGGSLGFGSPAGAGS